ETKIKGKLSWPASQPYFNQLGFGYRQDFVRGYELYVIDGHKYLLAKANLKYKLFSAKIDNSKIISIDKISTIPIAVFLKIYADAGYIAGSAEHPSSTFNEQLLLGWGAGIDLATYYDMVFRIEYSFNRNLEKGLYLHFTIDI
ncbi:MAG: hypothetical protein IH946_12150, partial [Bacteroidetes bacterium]|nr:hypothetical protein [Bacteroidota bacterium]